MNKAILIGRLTRDPEVRYSQGAEPMAIARYTLAVDRRFKREGEQGADFVPCIAFGRAGEFAEKYFRQGMKVAVAGRIQTGSYTNREGRKIYTTDVIVEEQEFAESRAAGAGRETETEDAGVSPYGASTDKDGFMSLPDGIGEELPFV